MSKEIKGKEIKVVVDEGVHRQAMEKAAELGLPLTQVMRTLVLAWLRGDVEVMQVEGRQK